MLAEERQEQEEMDEEMPEQEKPQEMEISMGKENPIARKRGDL
jgi:hypothetical protein